MNAIAMLPSPTADATRLIDPWRTSAAKTPGALVSSRYGLARAATCPLLLLNEIHDVTTGADINPFVSNDRARSYPWRHALQ